MWWRSSLPCGTEPRAPVTSRRAALGLGGGAAILLVRPALATPEAMAGVVAEFARGAPILPGRVRLDLPALVENGNSVTLTVAVDSPMTPADHVRAIGIFNQKNPLPDVAVFRLGPRAGRAAVTTRIRLADSQRVVAVAELSDGSFRSASADVIGTLAACVEGEGMARALVNVPPTR
jgi:sulfur-oxidizing protein SoxY